MVLKELGVGLNSKGLSVTGVKEDVDGDDKPVEDYLEGVEAKRFRAIAARLNYMAQDAPDVQYACKEVCGDMAKPRQSSWGKLCLLYTSPSPRD